VGNDVVELARDPRAFLGHSDACSRVPLALRDGRAYFRCLSLLGALAQSKAGNPGDHEIERDEDEPTRRVVGDLVDDERQTADNDNQADTRLPGVAQVPEQERDREADHEEGLQVRDQLPVHERDRGREHEVADRAAERKAPAREDREHQDRERRDPEPQRCASRLASDDQLEHGREREGGDQKVEPVLAGEVSDPHARNVLHAPARRLLPG
jgi:hypothetical protein